MIFKKLLLIFVVGTLLIAQGVTVTLELIKQTYRDFKYREVIHLSNIYFEQPGISKQDSIEVLSLVALSHYAVGQLVESSTAFTQILDLDMDYSLDVAAVSPKIITFYEEIKSTYRLAKEEDLKKQQPVKVQLFTKEQLDSILAQNSGTVFRDYSASILFPGLGHLLNKRGLKGYILTAITAISLISSIYFSIETNEKERIYLRETDILMIDSRYNDFNTVYKLRNIAFTVFALNWIYTQYDFTFGVSKMNHSTLNFPTNQFKFSYSVRF